MGGVKRVIKKMKKIYIINQSEKVCQRKRKPLELSQTMQSIDIHAYTYIIYLNHLNWNIFEKYFLTNCLGPSEKTSRLKIIINHPFKYLHQITKAKNKIK